MSGKELETMINQVGVEDMETFNLSESKTWRQK